ncbi:MAG: hypothetical protein JF611_08875 [Betaproteobacteria bacterium]|nr:hypothetical protein [Betaproteobacteria bacterium]
MSASLEELDDGVDEDEDDGVLEEPAPAAPPVELEGEELEDELAPPLAGLLVVSPELDEELDGEDELAPGVVAPEDDALPDGELDGELVVPLAEDAEPDGEVVEPDGAVDEELEDLSAPRSHAVISDAPSARETATARVESLMWPPWLGRETVSKDWAFVVISQPRPRPLGIRFASSSWWAACRRSSGRRRRRYSGNRGAGRRASGRPGLEPGWRRRVSPRL